MEMAPAMVPETAVNNMSLFDRFAPVTPATSKNVDTSPFITEHLHTVRGNAFQNSNSGLSTRQLTVIYTQNNISPVLTTFPQMFLFYDNAIIFL